MSNRATKTPSFARLRGLSPAVQRTLDAIKQIIETREGLRGDPDDRFVTVRELRSLLTTDQETVTSVGGTTVNVNSFSAKGSLIAGTGIHSFGELTVGNDNRILRAKNSKATGLEWVDILGTTNRITVTHNTNNITLTTPQDIHTGASPTFNDLTLSSPSNIYSLNHDSFAGFVANEHVDHSSVSIIAGTGLSGGGNITGNVTLNLSHLGLESLSDPDTDRIMFWDDSEGALKWLATDSNLTISGSTLGTVQDIGTADSPTFAQLNISPSSAVAPFVLNANAQGQLVSGLNADLLDGEDGSYYTNASNLSTGVLPVNVTPNKPYDVNLAGYWPLDDGVGSAAQDFTTNKNNGTVNGSPTWEDGISGRCLHFGSSGDYITLPSSVPLSSQYVTVTAWVKVASHGNYHNFVRNNWVNSGWLLYSSVNYWTFGVAQGGTSYLARYNHNNNTDWVFLAGVYDGSQVKLYVNAELVATKDLVGATLDTGYQLRIGRPDPPSEYWIDDVRIYTVALTEKEIKALYLDPPSIAGPYLRADVNTMQGDGLYVATDQIRARDGDGLKLYDDGGNGIFIADGGNIGINNNNPEAPLEINGNMMRINNDGYASYHVRGAGDAAGAAFVGNRARGTIASPSAVQQGDVLLSIQGRGYNGSSYDYTTAHIEVVAAEDFTSTAQGSYIRFHTVPTGSTSGTERMRINSSGYVGIGTDSPQQKLHVYHGHIIIQSADDDYTQLSFRKDTLDSTHIRWVLSSRQTNDEFWIYGYNGSTYKNMFKMNYPDTKIIYYAHQWLMDGYLLYLVENSPAGDFLVFRTDDSGTQKELRVRAKSDGHTISFVPVISGTYWWGRELNVDLDTGVWDFDQRPTVAGNNILHAGTDADIGSHAFKSSAAYPIQLTGSAAQLCFDNQYAPDGYGFKRITWNDGGGNFLIRLGCYYDYTDARDEYCVDNCGACEIRMDGDTSDGQINIKVAQQGLQGDAVSWSHWVRIDAVAGVLIDDYKVWHAGNDGSGSGLDADLLDGHEGDYYLPNDAIKSVATDQVFACRVTTDAYRRLILTADGKIYWGSGIADVDCVLQRRAANILNTPDRLEVGQLGIGGSSTSNSTEIGDVIRKIPIYNDEGTLLGFLAVFTGYSGGP